MRTSLRTALSQAPENSRIRICWPDPDFICLQGGCIHCADSNRVISVVAVARYAEKQELDEEFAYGLERNWRGRLQ